MTKTSKLAATVLGLCLVGASAHAGLVSNPPSLVVYPGDHFWGSMKSVQASPDTTSYIGCESIWEAPGPEVECWAYDTAGHFFWCYSDDVNFVHVVQSVQPSSWISMYVGPGGVCNETYVQLQSQWLR
jgi:hypothetical protein